MDIICYNTDIWLVVWNMAFIFPLILGMSSSQLTNSHFSEGLRPPTSTIYIYTHTNLKHPRTKGRKDNNTVMMYVYIYIHIFTMYTYNKQFVFRLILSNQICQSCLRLNNPPTTGRPPINVETITLHS